MIPEEKAKELVNKFNEVDPFSMNMRYGKIIQKKCSLACIEEIETALIECGELSDQLQNMDRELNYWQNVRKVIETM